MSRSLAEFEGDELSRGQEELDGEQKELTERQEVAAVLLPPRHAIPRNLRTNMFRGGRRPLDLSVASIKALPGTPMPAERTRLAGRPGTLTEEEMWQIVDYVRSLPFEPASQPQITAGELQAVVN